MDIFDYIQQMNYETPIRLSIGIDKFARMNTDNPARYMRVFINEMDVTRMIADLIDEKVASNGCIIVHGGGMDMGFALADDVSQSATRKGHPDIFERGDNYHYLGYFGDIKRGEYPYMPVSPVNKQKEYTPAQKKALNNISHKLNDTEKSKGLDR